MNSPVGLFAERESLLHCPFAARDTATIGHLCRKRVSDALREDSTHNQILK